MAGSELTPEQFTILFGDSVPDAPDTPLVGEPSGEANLSASDYLVLFGDSPPEPEHAPAPSPTPVNTSTELVQVKNDLVHRPAAGGIAGKLFGTVKSHPVASSAFVVGALVLGSAALDDRNEALPLEENVTVEVESSGE